MWTGSALRKVGSWSLVSKTSTFTDATSKTTHSDTQVWQHRPTLSRYSERASLSKTLEVFSNRLPRLWWAKARKSSLPFPYSLKCIPETGHHFCALMRLTGMLSPFTFEAVGEFSKTCPWKKGSRSCVWYPAAGGRRQHNKKPQIMLVVSYVPPSDSGGLVENRQKRQEKHLRNISFIVIHDMILPREPAELRAFSSWEIRLLAPCSTAACRQSTALQAVSCIRTQRSAPKHRTAPSAGAWRRTGTELLGEPHPARWSGGFPTPKKIPRRV